MRAHSSRRGSCRVRRLRPQPLAALFGCRGEVEQQFGEFFEVRVAESVFADEGGDEILSGQQRVDVQIQLLGQLRFGGFPDEFGGARLFEETDFVQKGCDQLSDAVDFT